MLNRFEVNATSRKLTITTITITCFFEFLLVVCFICEFVCLFIVVFVSVVDVVVVIVAFGACCYYLLLLWLMSLLLLVVVVMVVVLILSLLSSLLWLFHVCDCCYDFMVVSQSWWSRLSERSLPLCCLFSSILAGLPRNF